MTTLKKLLNYIKLPEGTTFYSDNHLKKSEKTIKKKVLHIFEI